MRKLLFFLPATLFTLFYCLVALGGIGAIHPLALVGLLLLWTAGILLCKGFFLGGVGGLLPAILLIYMGTQDTGQIFSETPIGVLLLLYYLGCSWYVYKKSRTNAR